jgi:hypothetical protein
MLSLTLGKRIAFLDPVSRESIEDAGTAGSVRPTKETVGKRGSIDELNVRLVILMMAK